jgi:hypothetical protein
VVVTPTLDWRLHAFDLTTEASLPGGPGAELPLAAAGFLVPPQYQPAELARSEWQVPPARGSGGWRRHPPPESRGWRCAALRIPV